MMLIMILVSTVNDSQLAFFFICFCFFFGKFIAQNDCLECPPYIQLGHGRKALVD